MGVETLGLQATWVLHPASKSTRAHGASHTVRGHVSPPTPLAQHSLALGGTLSCSCRPLSHPPASLGNWSLTRLPCSKSDSGLGEPRGRTVRAAAPEALERGFTLWHVLLAPAKLNYLPVPKLPGSCPSPGFCLWCSSPFIPVQPPPSPCPLSCLPPSKCSPAPLHGLSV